jgi:DNA-binding CsgD family transcriptional regulator/tetratricopeptide (TPR) repeat protein
MPTAEPFVGRASELHRLGRMLQDIAAGSRVVAVTGEAGAGKTRLIRQFQLACGRRPMFLIGRGSPLAAGVAFATLAEALEGELRRREAAEVLALCGARAAVLAAVLPSALAAAGPAATASPLVTLEALLALLRALAAERPLVLVLDDAHEADPSTWDFLGYIGRNRIDAAVLVLVVVRTTAMTQPGSSAADTLAALLKDGLADEIRVGALGSAELAELAQARLGARATADVVDWLAEKSGGNALFATALLDDAAAATGRRQHVPASVRERVRNVAASLDAPGRDLLELLSAVGRAIPLETLVALRPEAADAVDRLATAGLLTTQETDSGVALDFVHPVLREAVYENLPAGRRRRLHADLAHDLVGASADVRAYHAARGGTPGNEEALALVRAAAAEAREQARHRSAVTHLKAALELAPPSAIPLHRELLDELAWQASAVGDAASGVPALRRLAALASDPVGRASALLRLASLLAWSAGDVAGGVREATEALALLEQAGADERIPAARNELAWLRGAVGDIDGQIEGSASAAAEARHRGDQASLLHSLGSLGPALVARGRIEQGLAVLREGLGLAEDLEDSAQVEWFTAVLADELGVAGRFDEGLQVAARLDSMEGEATDIALSRWAWLLWCTGRWRDAAEKARLVQLRNPGLPPAHSAWALAIAAGVATAGGDVETARPYLAQADRVLAGRDLYWFSAWNDWMAGVALLSAGDTQGAVSRLSASARQLDAIGAVARLVHVLPDLVRARLEVGDIAGATSDAQRLQELAGELGHPVGRALADYAGGLAGSGKREPAALVKLERSTVSLLELGLGPAAARALEALAVVTSAGALRNRRLSEAARLHGSLPDLTAQRRALARLRQEGPMGRRAAQGVGALTPREREVALLARSGLGVRAIATRLFLSERTVESHLAHSYDKLGVRGREELSKLDAGLGSETTAGKR